MIARVLPAGGTFFGIVDVEYAFTYRQHTEKTNEYGTLGQLPG